MSRVKEVISRRGFLELGGLAAAILFIPRSVVEMRNGGEIKKSWVELELYNSSDIDLKPNQVKAINLEAKSAFDFANKTLKNSFSQEVEGFSVVGVTPIKLQKHGLFEFPDNQILINLLGRDKIGEFSFNLLKMDRYYPLFNLTELPPALKETPERMPVMTFPREETNRAYTNMWNETSFQICPTADRTVNILPTKNIPESRLAAWLMDFSGDKLQDLIYDGREYNAVLGGIPGGKIITTSGEYEPANQKFSKTPPFRELFYINRENSRLVALNGNGEELGYAVFGLANEWEWHHQVYKLG